MRSPRRWWRSSAQLDRCYRLTHGESGDLIRRSLAVLTTLLVALSGLSACGDSTTTDSAPVGGAKSSTPSEAPPTITDDPLTWVPPEPQRPRDVKSKAGAIALASYAPLVTYYAVGTGKADELTKIADAKLCKVCRLVSRNIVKLTDAKAVELRKGPVRTSNAKVTNVDGDFMTVTLDVVYPAGGYFNPETGERYKALDRVESDAVFNVRWVDDRWLLLDYETNG